MQKEARLIVPTADNEGNRLDDLATELEARLTETFGGFTRLFGIGGYRDKNGATIKEPVWVYDVAVPFNVATAVETLDALYRLARLILEKGKQQSVYLRLPDGRVEFVEAPARRIAA